MMGKKSRYSMAVHKLCTFASGSATEQHWNVCMDLRLKEKHNSQNTNCMWTSIYFTLNSNKGTYILLFATEYTTDAICFHEECMRIFKTSFKLLPITRSKLEWTIDAYLRVNERSAATQQTALIPICTPLSSAPPLISCMYSKVLKCRKCF